MITVELFAKKSPSDRHWYAYDVLLNGETIVANSRDPEHDLARALLRRARRWGSDLGPVLNIDGKPIQDIKIGFAAACKRAGIEGVTPRILRHTAATWLMQSGVLTWQAAEFLAMTEKVLIDTYAHHHPDYMRDAAEAISKCGSRMGA